MAILSNIHLVSQYAEAATLITQAVRRFLQFLAVSMINNGTYYRQHEKKEAVCVIENFQVNEPLFEGRINQIHQFSLTYEGTKYHGLFDDGNIKWYQPKPESNLEEMDLTYVETKVRGLMENYSQ